MTGTPASRPPGQRPRHRHPGTAARQAGLPGRLGHEPSLPGTGRPGQGALVLQHAPPQPGPQPESPTSPQTGTMTTRHRARHAHCQPRHEPGTLMATVTPSTSTPAAGPCGHRQMTLPPPHRAILNGAGQQHARKPPPHTESHLKNTNRAQPGSRSHVNGMSEANVRPLGAGERIRTADLPFTRSTAICNMHASCTDGTGYRTDGARRAGIIWSAGPRTGPRVAARRYP